MPSARFARTISPAGARGANACSKDVFLLLLLVGFTVGVFALGYMGRALTVDERWTMERITQPIGRMLEEIRHDFVHPPLYYVVLRLWVHLTNPSIFFMRTFSLLFALWAIILISRVGRELFSPREGRWAAFLLAISNFHLYYAVDIRMYSMVAALSLLTHLWFWRAFVHDAGRKSLWAYSVGIILLTGTHYLTWPLVGGQGGYLLLRQRERGHLRSWARSVGGAALLSLVWIMWGISSDPGSYGNAVNNLRTLQGIGARSLSGAIYLFGAFHGMLPFPDTMRYGFLPWSLPFLALGWRWQQELSVALRARRSAAAIRDLLVTPSGYLIFTLAVPIVGLTIVSLVLFPLFLPRYLIYGLPMYYLLVSRCAVLAAPSVRGQFLLLLPAIGWSLASAFSYQLPRWFG